MLHQMKWNVCLSYEDFVDSSEAYVDSGLFLSLEFMEDGRFNGIFKKMI